MPQQGCGPLEFTGGSEASPANRTCPAPMIELIRTNDLVLISVIEALLAEDKISCFVADQHMSAVEGSLGFLPRRIMVPADALQRARRLLTDAGFADELRRD